MVLRFLDGDRSDCFFVIFGPNGDFDKEIMKGKRRFGARFGFAFLWGGGVLQRFRLQGGGPSLGGAGHSAEVKKTHKLKLWEKIKHIYSTYHRVKHHLLLE